MSYQYNQPVEHVNMEALVDGIMCNGVISGLTVSERGGGQNQSVDVAVGSCNVDGSTYIESGIVNVPLDAAHATLARKDLIYYDTTAGNPAQVAGTAGASPVPPDIPAGDILLAVVNRNAGDNTVANTDINDGRIYVNNRFAHTSLSANTTLDDTYCVVTIDASGGSRTITLPTAVGVKGKIYVIKKIDSSSNTVTVDGNGTETIDGSITKIIYRQWAVVIIQSDGSNWIELAERVDNIVKGLVVPSDDLIHSNDTERSTTVSSYTKLKEIELSAFSGGKLRIKFDMHGDASGYCRAKIYRNGVAVGTEREKNATYTTYSEDVDEWVGGDLLQIYAYTYSTYTGYVRNLRIYGRQGTLVVTNVISNQDP